jgi:hypothetical protein
MASPLEQVCVVSVEEVPVAVERRSDRGVSEPHLDLLGVPSLGREDGGARMAQVVEAQTVRHPGVARAEG